jgi:5'(3')-deoxyribonucleotidase
LRIAIDVDDVVLGLMDSWLAIYNKVYNTSFLKAQMTNWDLTKNGLDPSVYGVLQIHADEIYSNAMPIDGAVQGVKRIVQAGYDIVFVTAAITGTMDAKAARLEQLGFLQNGRSLDDRLVIAGNKNLVSADVLIDDKPMNILKWPYPRTGLLFTQPWNEEVVLLPERSSRVDGWKGVMEHLGLIRGSYERV